MGEGRLKAKAQQRATEQTINNISLDPDIKPPMKSKEVEFIIYNPLVGFIQHG